MFPRRSFIIKYTLLVSIGVVLYCEWFMYWMQPMYWSKLQCLEGDESCTKVLMIADPQIQGYNAVKPPLSYIYNFDSDTYLQSTFSVVMLHFMPDILVFLGDLMDEGSIATKTEYHNYVERLNEIFSIDYPVTQIYIPGDNDIGGENEPISVSKMKLFDRVFDQPDTVVAYKNITFYKVNGIAHILPEIPKWEKERDNLKVVVSHYPLTVSTVFGQQVNQKIRPNIYFCAHDHQSKYVKQTKDLKERVTVNFYGSDILHVDFTNEWIYEIFVPTCSYRMGTAEIGYGAVVFDNNNQQMRYTVYWSPFRFPVLFVYLVIFVFLAIYGLIYCAGRSVYSSMVKNPITTNTRPRIDHKQSSVPFLVSESIV